MTSQPFRILGIDPGSRATGYGVIEKRGNDLEFISCGVIRPPQSKIFAERLRVIYDGVCEVIATHGPSKTAVEDVFVSKNASSALKLGHARGAILLALIQNGLELFEYSPRVVKKTVAGYGQAPKAQMQQMVRLQLGLSSSPSHDAADALAVAICMASHWRPTKMSDK